MILSADPHQCASSTMSIEGNEIQATCSLDEIVVMTSANLRSASHASGEKLTWQEVDEIMDGAITLSGQNHTNNTSCRNWCTKREAPIEDVVKILRKGIFKKGALIIPPDPISDDDITKGVINPLDITAVTIEENDQMEVTPNQNIQVVKELKRIKEVPALNQIIREFKLRNNLSVEGARGEKLFIVRLIVFLVIGTGICVTLHLVDREKYGSIQIEILTKSLVLFVPELLWLGLLSSVVRRYRVPINYSRKLSHLLRIPKYFLVDYIPGFSSTPVALLLSFMLNQLLYVVVSRRHFWPPTRISAN